jgi:hypothetical protein
MSVIDEVRRTLAEVRRELDDVRIENRVNADALAGAIRQTRNQVVAAELQQSMDRTRPSSATVMWDVRSGQFIVPDLQTSLISRLREGDAVGDVGGASVWPTNGRNLLIDPTLEGGAETAINLTLGTDLILGLTPTVGSSGGTVGAGCGTVTPQFAPSLICDGNDATYVSICNAVRTSGTHWEGFWDVDLGTAKTVGQTTLMCRGGLNGTGEGTFVLYKSDDGVAYTLVVTLGQWGDDGGLRHYFTVPNVTARYWRLQWEMTSAGGFYTGSDPTSWQLFQTDDHVVTYGVETSGYGEPHRILEAWYAKASSGSAQVGGAARRGQTVTPFNSEAVELVSLVAANTITLRSTDITPNAGWEAVRLPDPYLNAAIVVWRRQGTATTQSATLELYNSTTLAVVATSTIDLNSIAIDGLFRLTCGFQPSDAQKAHSYQLRLRYDTTGGAGSPAIHLGDPMLSLAFTPETPAYSPALGRWFPELAAGVGSYLNNILAVGKLFGEPQDRFRLSVAGWLEWKDGTNSSDARLFRTGVSELTWDNGVGNPLYTDPGGPVTTKHIGPLFVQGPNSMDLAITYASAAKPSLVTRTDAGLISTTTISYTGDKVSSVVTTRFGKTITVTPTYTGNDITSVHRGVA